jgi:hydrogenase expression/formation protein HypC
MCLGLPAQLLELTADDPDLARVDLAGAPRMINIGLLDERETLAPGDWLLVHMGFALEAMTADEAHQAIRALGAERDVAGIPDPLDRK